jgi:voltage-gated potassium channel
MSRPNTEQVRARAASLRRRRAARVHTIFDPPATVPSPSWPPWRKALNHVIFGADSAGGQIFDWTLLVLIALSVLVVMLDSVAPIRAQWGGQLGTLEWFLTVIFTAEYIVRLAVVKRPLGYATSFFGVVDLVSVLPTWLSLGFEGSEVLAVIRVLRMLRVFRLMQLSQFADESEALAAALVASVSRITVFLGGVLTIAVIMGSTMYVVEGPGAGFDSIPRGVYWAIVTLTTVGYGDIAPQTPLGQAIAAAVMILGYSIIAVPTGIVSAEVVAARRDAVLETDVDARRDVAADVGAADGERPAATCGRCAATRHASDARFCRVCGTAIDT